MLFSLGPGVNSVSDASVTTRGLPLVQYKDREKDHLSV